MRSTISVINVQIPNKEGGHTHCTERHSDEWTEGLADLFFPKKGTYNCGLATTSTTFQTQYVLLQWLRASHIQVAASFFSRRRPRTAHNQWASPRVSSISHSLLVVTLNVRGKKNGRILTTKAERVGQGHLDIQSLFLSSNDHLHILHNQRNIKKWN